MKYHTTKNEENEEKMSNNWNLSSIRWSQGEKAGFLCKIHWTLTLKALYVEAMTSYNEKKSDYVKNFILWSKHA